MLSILKFIFKFNLRKDSNIKILEAQDFKKAISNKKVQLIDVRTLDEFNSRQIKKAKNIDVFSSKFNSEVHKFDKEKPIFLYCRSGNRSKRASKKLVALGFKKIYDLKGGFLEYN